MAKRKIPMFLAKLYINKQLYVLFKAKCKKEDIYMNLVIEAFMRCCNANEDCFSKLRLMQELRNENKRKNSISVDKNICCTNIPSEVYIQFYEYCTAVRVHVSYAIECLMKSFLDDGAYYLELARDIKLNPNKYIETPPIKRACEIQDEKIKNAFLSLDFGINKYYE